jgi:hypothetical protein
MRPSASKCDDELSLSSSLARHDLSMRSRAYVDRVLKARAGYRRSYGAELGA